MCRVLIVCTTDSMIWNFLIPHIKNLEKNGLFVECACSETGAFFDDLVEKHHIKMNKVPFKRSPFKLSNYSAYRRVCNIIKRDEINIIFCHEPVGGAIGRLAGHKYHCKVVYMAHGFHFYKGAPKSRILFYWIEKWLSKYTDTLITINKEDYETSQSFNAKETYKINGIGVDTSKFIYLPNKNYLRKELKIPSNSVVLLSVGELIARKNHEVVIRAMHKLNIPNIYYVVVGEGKLHRKLKQLIHKFNLDNNVFLLGYRNDINALCNSSDIFVMPSIHEGLSVALMEAMSCGKPIIASRIRGNVDLIDDEFGILCDTFSIDDYAQAINKMYLNLDKWSNNGLKAIDAVKKYDIEAVKKELFNMIGVLEK